MKYKKLCLLFAFILIFISSSYVSAEPYKSGKFPSDEIINKNLLKMTGKIPGMKGAKYIGKRKLKKDLYKVFYSVKGSAVGINLDELDYALSVNLEKLDNDIWILDKVVLQK